MRISDWSSDVCSSDLRSPHYRSGSASPIAAPSKAPSKAHRRRAMTASWGFPDFDAHEGVHLFTDPASGLSAIIAIHSTALGPAAGGVRFWHRSEEHTSELQSLMRISYAVFCLKNKIQHT